MPQSMLERTFAAALQHHQAGRLAEAENLYRKILAQQPAHAEALHLLGVIAAQTGQNSTAVELIQKALALKPNWPIAHNNVGNAYRALAQFDHAVSAFQRAIALYPNYFEAHNNLGVVLKDKGQLDQAIAAFRHTLVLNPEYPQAYSNLGNALTDKGQYDDAIAACRQAVSLDPTHAEARSNLGNALREMGQVDEAIAEYRSAIATQPNLPEAHYNLGVALEEKEQWDEALAAYRQAIALRPTYAKAYCNLGNLLGHLGSLDDAVPFYHQAISLNPNLPEAHYNLSLVRLAHGDFLQGWPGAEWRWKCKDVRSWRRNFLQPQWNGDALDKRTILLHSEQGFGDTIQFIRYLPLVNQRGGRIIVECQKELVRLIAGMSPDITVVAKDQPLPDFDVHCPLMSLPLAMKTTLQTIPSNVPYIRAEDQDVERWGHRLSDQTGFAKVGLVWAGNRQHKNDRNRSVKLASLAVLGGVPGACFFTLAKGTSAADANTPPPGMRLIDLSAELTDFADTAALIANLDLVITVDTAAAHLAGAMGKPVWTLLPFAPDWRWLLEGEDSPWYPTMRLFRQQRRGDWESVISQVEADLREWVKDRRRFP